MSGTAKTYAPSPEVVKLLAGTGETLFQYVCRHAQMVKARESKLGAYVGDGPTPEQVDSFLASLCPITQSPDSFDAAVGWDAFRAAGDLEMTWLFPERDRIGAPMTEALGELQNMIGWALDRAVPDMAQERQRYVSLAVAERAARRMQKASAARPLWSAFLMAMARFLWWLGGGERR